MSRTSVKPGDIRVGTSGWVYPHWKELFYPAGMPESQWFAHYAAEFDTVEINKHITYVYFNNDLHGHALRNARTLKELLGL